jgi:hypothetical protein
VWDEVNGFGFINVNAAIIYNKYIPKAYPFIISNLEAENQNLKTENNNLTTLVNNLTTLVKLLQEQLNPQNNISKIEDLIKVSNIIYDFQNNYHDVDIQTTSKEYDFQ